MLKRDNWTKDELIELIQGQYICSDDGNGNNVYCDYSKEYNSHLDYVCQLFNVFEQLTFTNNEIIQILKDLNVEKHAEGFEAVYMMIRDFMFPAEEFGALAYDTEKGITVHIGNTQQ